MGTVAEQTILTLAVRVVDGAIAPGAGYIQSTVVRSFERISAGLYEFQLRSVLSLQEQQPGGCLYGTDPDVNFSFEPIGDGATFSSFRIHTFSGGAPADVDLNFWLERIRTASEDE